MSLIVYVYQRFLLVFKRTCNCIKCRLQNNRCFFYISVISRVRSYLKNICSSQLKVKEKIEDATANNRPTFTAVMENGAHLGVLQVGESASYPSAIE